VLLAPDADNHGMRFPVFVTLLLTVLLATGTGTSAAHPLVTEFHDGLTGSNGAWGVATGPDGNVWFTEDNTGAVGRITPDGVVTEFSAGLTKGGPKGIALGPDGNLWVAESSGGGAIARITPSGAATEFTAGLSVGEPWDIAAGPDGNLWFVMRNPAVIGRITPEGVITEFTVGLTPGSEPTSIAAGPDGNLWFTEAADPGRIGRITPAGEISEFSAGLTPNMRPTDITAGPDGKLWFTELAGAGAIGRIKTSGEIQEFTEGMTAGMEPMGIAAGNDGALWFTQSRDPGRLGRITTDGLVTEHGDGLTIDQGPWFIAPGPDGNMWFTENGGSGQVARVTVPPGVEGAFSDQVGKTTARLRAYVRANSQTTDYLFEYGVDGNLDQQSHVFAAGRSADPAKVAATLQHLEPGTAYEFRVVATNDAGTSVGPTGEFVTDESPSEAVKFELPARVPDFARSVVAKPRGKVRFKAPGGRWQVLGEDGGELPVGSRIDARRGSITLTSADGGEALQTGTFGGGVFSISQRRRAGGRVDLHLRGGNFSRCGRAARGNRASASAVRRVRRLWGRDRGGRFRTHGRHSHATVRGTRWLTEDRCRGTFTRVTEGSVVVRDLARRKSVVVRAGRSYLARPPR
jgi:streptogramin lyase